ncbi:MAG: penicillin-binding protein, partial [Clostridiales bacterium]|nr:penicillin-binding protein [Clostridiales bacterium]
RRKINEMRLARALERVYSKDRILESYFNILYFGSGIYGLGTASRVMFDKSASELTVAEAAALASIINNPTKYSPYNNPDNLSKRTALVLKLMLQQNYITDQEYNDALKQPLTFNKNKQNQFIEGVIKDACRRYNCNEKQLFAGNYTIHTAYDGIITASARNAIKDLGNFDGTIRVLVLDNQTGRIVCDETNIDKYIDARHSPASTIKPFLSYSPALEILGYNPMTQINDEKTFFGDYSPRNYKNIYRGWQSLEDCLIYSSNVAAVKLFTDVGADNALHTAEAFGLKLDEEDITPAVALGGLKYGVTLPELANAYRTLANGGIYSDCGYVAGSIANSDEYIQNSHAYRAVSPDTAYILTDMLTKCAERGTAKKLAGIGNIAAKTGTNGDRNGNYDCYCVAYTATNTIAVWLGADQNPIDNNITGASCAKIIKKLFDDGVLSSAEKFSMPDSVAYYEIDNRALRDSHEVYLADPLLPKRYRTRVLLSKRHLPIRKNIDYIDYFDEYYWIDFLDSLN